MSHARTMRLASNLPPNCWDEFVVTSCYLSNRVSVKSQQGLTPFECWSGHKPNVSHLREIGCRAFVLIQSHNPKVNARSVECVLIGYSANSKAYRCYHHPTNKVFVSFHVSFIESHETVPHPFHVTADPSNTDDTAPATPPPLPPAPAAPSDVTPWCSTRVIQPSERLCALNGVQYVPPATRRHLQPSVTEVPDVDAPPTSHMDLSEDDLLMPLLHRSLKTSNANSPMTRSPMLML